MNPKSLFVSVVIYFFPLSVFAFSPVSISIQPDHIIQGYPIMITVDGTSTLSGIKNIMFDTKILPTFMYANHPRALYGVDLHKKVGTSTITVTLQDGTKLTKDIAIEAREKIEAPLGIPKTLGGNTATSSKKLVDTLAIENKSLSNVRTSKTSFWKKAFQYPIENPIVTDDYGYSRTTGTYTIAHKGTDFRAVTGTQVVAMNRGVVRIAKTYRNYGKTIVIDHGQGLMTFYMHLSKINVTVGQVVDQGQILGLSGKTGYAEGSHLHLTVRINDISIDPIVFIGLFK